MPEILDDVRDKLYIILEKINKIKKDNLYTDINPYNSKIYSLYEDINHINFYIDDIIISIKNKSRKEL